MDTKTTNVFFLDNALLYDTVEPNIEQQNAVPFYLMCIVAPLSLSLSLHASGQTKVTQLHVQVVVEEKVPEFDVPVNYLLQGGREGGRREGGRGRGREGERGRGRERGREGGVC